jgi:hypothetical protein
VNANGVSTSASFDYGTSTNYGANVVSPQSPVTGNTDTQVSASITGLAPNTIYHFRVNGSSAGGMVNGLDQTFLTPNNVATLDRLVLTSGTLTPAFASSTTSYSVTVDNSIDTIKVTPTLTDPNATLTVNTLRQTSGQPSDEIHLNFGANPIVVAVTAQDGMTIQTYNIVVNRPVSTDATLSALALGVGSLSPGFSGSITAYTVTVPAGTSFIHVTPTASNSNAIVTVDGSRFLPGIGVSVPLNPLSTNTITVEVTAQDGVTKLSYSISVNMPPPQISVCLFNNNTVFTSGASTAVFPGASIGKSCILTFNIANNGTGPLTVSDITFSGANAADFTVTTPAATNVNPGASTAFSVTFAPTTAMAESAVLSIYSNDPNFKPFTVLLAGQGLNSLATWRQAYFPGSTATTGPGADSATPQNDGVSNLIKFATGMDPSPPGVMPGVTTLSGSLMSFTYTPSAAAVADGVTFIVEYSTSPGGPWSSADVDQGTIGAGGSPVTATVSPSPNFTGFMRLKIWSPN